MWEFDPIQSGLALLILLVIGESLSRKMKAAVPAVLAAGLLFMAGCWAGIFPADMAERSGFPALAPVIITLVIVNMGTTTNLKELAANVRVVILAAVSFAGQILILFLVIGALFGINTAVAGLPGGMATNLIIQEQARSLGYDRLVVLAVLVLSTQGLLACPLASWMIKKETRRLLAEKQAGGRIADEEQAFEKEEQASEKKGSTVFLRFMKLFAAAWLASRLEQLTGLSRYVMALFLGVLAGEARLLEKNSLEKTQSSGLVNLLMMSMVMGGFARATPAMFAQVLIPLAAVLACEVGGIFLVSWPVGKLLGFSRPMSFAIALNVMVGFPLNLILSEDVIGYLTEDPAERSYLISQIGTKMVLGGFTSTTVLATVAAGVLAGLMH
jgi:hypothetical protein